MFLYNSSLTLCLNSTQIDAIKFKTTFKLICETDSFAIAKSYNSNRNNNVYLRTLHVQSFKYKIK